MKDTPCIGEVTARGLRYSVLENYHLQFLGMDDMRSWREAPKDYTKGKGRLK